MNCSMCQRTLTFDHDQFVSGEFTPGVSCGIPEVIGRPSYLVICDACYSDVEPEADEPACDLLSM